MTSRDNGRIERKRIQNRISQRCLREKQVARSRQTASFLELVKATRSSGNPEGALIDAHLKVIEENQALKEAILRMRKKLLSISNSSAAAADDSMIAEILDTMSYQGKLARKGNRAALSTESENDILTHVMSAEASSTALTDNWLSGSQLRSSDKDIAPVGEIQTRTSATSLGYHHHIFETSLTSDMRNSSLARVRSRKHPASKSGCRKSSHSLKETEFPQPLGLTSQASLDSFDLWADTTTLIEDVSDSVPHYPQYLDFIVDAPKALQPRCFGPCIEKACALYICKAINLSIDQNETHAESNLWALKVKYCDKVSNALVADMAEIAVDLMCRFTRMNAYVYGVGANQVMELIMRWRISPSLAHRLAIPEPFRPTPLQYTNCNHPLSVDMVTWPTLRDQLILYSDDSHLDEIIDDIVSHTVMEIPQMQISLNVMDVFTERVLPKLDASDNIFSIVTNSLGLGQCTMDQYVGHTIRSRMAGHENEGFAGAFDNHDTQFKSPKVYKHQLASQYGLDRLSEWKLSKEFCLKYPNLECSSIAASFPMIPSSALLA